MAILPTPAGRLPWPALWLVNKATNSREIVTRAFDFGSTERMPVVFPRDGVEDTHSAGWNQHPGKPDLRCENRWQALIRGYHRRCQC